jgi:hypothetical protein
MMKQTAIAGTELPTENTKSAADVAFKAMTDARAKLKAAGVDYYLVVAWDGFVIEDGSVSASNASSIVQRLDTTAARYQKSLPE